MTQGSYRPVLALVVVALLAMTGAMAYGQGAATTSSLTGVVTDTSGGVIPGADILAKHNATSAEFRAVSDATGTFTLQSLPPGPYTVTISLMGFKTVILPDVSLVVAQPARVKITLEVGQLQETVTVTGATEIVQTESASVATTLSTKQISTVPLPTRNTLDFVAALPGVTTTSSIRGSTVMGLQASATNITIDGINVQDNYLKSSDGFFARINPRMDAVEEVSVSTANPGAESAGQGAVQIRFVTRSGTNKFQGSGYEFMRRPSFNTNYWFNIQQSLPKEQVKVDTWGGRLGGPIKKDKMFFFFNYEQFNQPGTVSRSRTLLTPAASAGTFTWNSTSASSGIVTCNGTTCSLPLLTLAANQANPRITSTTDALTAQVLAALQTAAASPGSSIITGTGQPIIEQLNFFNVYSQIRRYPTTRLDYNVTSKHRVGLSYYFQQYVSLPDTLNTYDSRFPGFPVPAGQNSNRWSWVANWRWSVSSNIVNEARGGETGGPVKFGDGINNTTMQTGPFANWGGFVPSVSSSLMSQMYTGRAPTTRNAPTYFLEDTFSWLKGKHSISVGASWTKIVLDYYNPVLNIPYLGFGVDTNDPANAMFTSTNFPGSSSTDLTNAKNLYAFLTGRITSINEPAYVDGATGKYVANGSYYENAHQNELGFYVSDSWKMRPDLTLTYGIRYELQLPFLADNHVFSRPLSYCNTFGASGCAADGVTPNLFVPGSMNGTATQFREYTVGDKAYQTNYTNFAPSFGVAWRPHISSTGFLAKIFSADPVFRGGYSKAYTREGIGAFDGLYFYNPGGNVDASRTLSLGNLVTTPTTDLPLLLRNGFAALGPGAFAAGPSYPYTPLSSNSVNEFYPQTQTPFAHSFNISFQRPIGKNMAVDIRYVGTRQHGGWVIGGRNMNEFNVIENGFLDEFKLAQANLAANIAAGRGSTYAYKGAGTGTSPLPIMLAWLNGSTLSSDSTKYTGAAWTSSTLYGYLAKMSPAPQSFASYLQTASSTYAVNAAAAGLPANFFVLNPGLSSGGSYVTGRPQDSYNNRFDAVQIELRRRMSGGLLVQGSYQYIVRSDGTTLYSLRVGPTFTSTSAPKQQLKINWAYELPFGQGKPVMGGVGRIGQMLVGGWSFDGNLRAQSGNKLDYGNVRLVGMSDEQLQNEFYLRFVKDTAGITHVYMLPDDIIQNTIKAYSYSATTTTGYGSLGAPTGRYFEPISAADPLGNPTGCINGYTGQCTGGVGLHHYVIGPAFFRTDIGVSKRIDFTRRVWGDFRVDVLNVFNNIDYLGTTGTGTSTSSFEVTSAYRDSSNTQDPGGRLMQLSFRVSF